MTRYLCLVLGAASATGCGQSPPSKQIVVLDFEVESDPGAPLEGVSIAVDGNPIGQSNATGSLRATISAKLGQRIRIEHDCPQGYRDPTEPKMIR